MNDQPVSSGFHALSEPIRIEIIELLREGELCVSEICEELGIAQSKASFHLKILRESGLIMARQQGRWMYYHLNAAEFSTLEEYLSAY